MKKIAINGFGRIGRTTLKTILKESKDLEIVAVNDLTDPKTLAHLFKYDTVYGKFDGTVVVIKDGFMINGKLVKVFSEKNPENLPWGELGVDIVIESTGIFRTKEKASMHITAGAKKVVISAPGDGEMNTVVYGVNEEILKPEDKIISAASCTTNALSLLVDALHKEFKLVKGICTTIHGYTSDQRIQDAPHSDLRRARAAFQNMIPTSSGAAIAIAKVIPDLKGRLDAFAIRVPVITGSVVDFTFELEANPTVEELNAAIKKYESPSFAYETDPIVSSDIIGHSAGSIFDSLLTTAISDTTEKNMYKAIAWYDNEASYVHQLVRVVAHVAKITKYN